MKFIISRQVEEGYVVSYDVNHVKKNDVPNVQRVDVESYFQNGMLSGVIIGIPPLKSFPSQVTKEQKNFTVLDEDIQTNRLIKSALAAIITPSVIKARDGFIAIDKWIYIRNDVIYLSRQSTLFLFGWPNFIAGKSTTTDDVLKFWAKILKHLLEGSNDVEKPNTSVNI